MGKHPCIGGILLRMLICTTALMAISATACAGAAWTELTHQRDQDTRVWSVTREVQHQRPDGTKAVETVSTQVIEKGSGICYKNEDGRFVPSHPHWEATAEGFVLRECAYVLSAGKTLSDAILYTTGGRDLRFRPAFLAASDGTDTQLLAAVSKEVEGVVDAEDPRRLLFTGAFGDLGDLEILAEKGALHQNLLLNKQPAIAPGFSSQDTRVLLYTELSLDEFLGGGGTCVRAGTQILDRAGADLQMEPSKTAPIAFYETVGAGTRGAKEDLLHFFAESPVYDSCPGQAAALPSERAQRQLLRDPSTNATYLVESLPLRFFEGAKYPVTWDFVSIPTQYEPGEPWQPCYTYRITANFYVSGTLEILPGTVVKLDPSFSICINPAIGDNPAGKIIAKGEPYDYITFTRSEDDTCGEIIPDAPAGPYMYAVQLASGSSPDSIIQYCKMGNGICGIYCGQSLDPEEPEDPENPIAHNVIRHMGMIGINVQWGGGLKVSCRNNLLTHCGWYGIWYYNASANEITNNTVDHCGCGIELQDCICVEQPPEPPEPLTKKGVTYNLLTNCGVGIGVSGGNLTLNWNGYWNNTYYNVSGGQPGPKAVELEDAENPYDTCSTGNFYLKSDEDPVGQKLRDKQGGRSVEDAGLAGEKFTVNKPNVAPVSITSNQTWWKVANDIDVVDIGYHHNRVDWVLDNANTTVTNCGLIIEPGVVAAISGYARQLYIGTHARLLCVGNRHGGQETLITSNRSVSMGIEASFKAPQSPTEKPNEYQVGILLDSGSSFASQVAGTTFRGLYHGIKTDGMRTLRALGDNRFFCCKVSGVCVRGSALPDVRNSLFSNCGKAIIVDSWYSEASTVLQNNTLDRSDYGVWIWGGWTEEEFPTVRIYNSLLTYNCSFGIGYEEGYGFYYAIDHCGFWGNNEDLQDQPYELSDTNRVPITSDPYDPSADAYGPWYLDQSGAAVDSTCYYPPSLGFGPHTTALDGRLDHDLADIGYHYRSSDPPPPAGDDPSASIVEPLPDTTVTGVTTVIITADDTLGDNPGVSEVHVYWNGRLVLTAEGDPQDPTLFSGHWHTNSVLNGGGTLQAIARDYDGNVAASPCVALTLDNLITCLSSHPAGFNPNLGEALVVTAVLSEDTAWDLTIRDPDDHSLVANVASSQGTHVIAEWDGTDDLGETVEDGPYTYRVHAGASSQTAEGGTASHTVAEHQVEAVLFASYDRPVDRKLFKRLQRMFKYYGIKSKSFLLEDASWDNLEHHLKDNPNCYLFLYSGHGTAIKQGGEIIALSFPLWWNGQRRAVYDQRYHAPVGYHGHTVEDLGLGPQPEHPYGSPKMKLVYMDSCHLGTLWPPSNPDAQGASAIAIQFGVYSGAGDQAYVGFRGKVDDLKKINFTDTFFYYLMGEDMTVEQALIATVDLRYHSHTNRCEKVRGQGNSCSGCKIPPQ